MGKPSRTTRSRIDVARRRAKLLELRRAGLTYAEIVRDHPDLGYRSPAAAAQDGVRAINAVLSDPARDVLALELSRLDALTQGLWPKARRGDNLSVDRVLRVMERRAKLLGLDYGDRNTDASDAEEVRGMLGDLAEAMATHVASLEAGPADDHEEPEEATHG